MKLPMITFVALALLLVSCAPPPSKPMRIASSPWPGYEPLYLARELGYLDESKYNLTELPSSNITMEAFSNRSADIATLTLDETLSLLAEGRKVRILFVLDVSNGADAVMASPKIKALADLKGKRIAIVNIPLGVYMLTRTLEKAGLKASDVTIVTLPEDRHEQAFREGKIDVSINFEPFKTNLAKAGMHVLFDSSKIPNEIFDLLVVQEDVYKERREEICELAGHWFKTFDYIQSNTDQAVGMMAHRVKVPPSEFRNSLKELLQPSKMQNAVLLGGAAPALLTPAKKLADVMLGQRLLPVAVDPSQAIDPTFQSCIK